MKTEAERLLQCESVRNQGDDECQLASGLIWAESFQMGTGKKPWHSRGRREPWLPWAVAAILIYIQKLFRFVLFI